MERAEEFMDLYLGEKSRLAQLQHRLGRRFETRFWAPEYRQLYLDRRELKAQSPETILNVEESANDAQVITTGRPCGMPKRYRYQLRRSTNGWQIHEIQWECFLCGGTGARDGVECQVCDGEGWKDSMKRDE
jgi:hypothetical protein